MEFVILVLFALGIVAFVSRMRQRVLQSQQRPQVEAALAASRAAAEEDVTKFGEELQRLDTAVAGHALDQAMQQDYTRALDAYDNAKSSLAAVKQPDEIRYVTEVLEDGRYAVACVKARVNNQPLPQRRPPCFFNPAHGPSTQNVTWAPPGGAPRSVPACAADAERVLAGADPFIRSVQVGARRVPYWQAGPAYAPWAQGYYRSWAGSDLIRDMMIGSLIFQGINGLPYLMNGVGRGVGDIGAGIGDMFSGAGQGLDSLGNDIGQGLDDLGNGLGDIAGDIGNGLGDIANDIGGFFNDLF